MSTGNLWSYTVFLITFLFQLGCLSCNQEEFQSVSDCTIRITSSLTTESIIPNQDENCETFFYEITASKESSIIYITSLEYLNDTISSTPPAYLNDTSSTTSSVYFNDSISSTPNYPDGDAFFIQNQETEKISVEFVELSFLSSGENSSVVLDRWYFTNKNFRVHRQYLSRTPFLRIHTRVSGNWSGNGIKLTYKEVEFNVFKTKTSKELGEISLTEFEEDFQDSYHYPNSAYIFQILKTRNINSSSISLTLKFDIDEGIGEYLLIGSGAIPFHGPPPLFIANDENEKKFQVNDENAYIVFVATSSLREKSSSVFSIRWKHRGSKITVDEDVDNPVKDDILQSIQICIYNITSGLEELQKSKTEQFKSFKEELARKSNELQSSMKDPLSNISSSQISFYRLSAIDRSEKTHKDGVLYVMLKVEGSSKGKAAFDREFLLKAFRSISSLEEDGYEIRECPKRTPVSAGFYAMIPLFCTVLFFGWIWNNYSFSHYFQDMEEDFSIEENEQDMAEGNPYSEAPVLGNQQGLSGCRIRQPVRPQYNQGFEDEEGNTLPKHIHEEGASNETENHYDSLKSSKSVNRIYDTKL